MLTGISEMLQSPLSAENTNQISVNRHAQQMRK